MVRGAHVPVVPQVIPAPDPVLVPSGEGGEEPRGYRHHVRYAVESALVLSVNVGRFVASAVRRGVPAEEPVDCALAGGTLRAKRRVLGHEEAPGAGLNVEPITGVAYALEGRHKGH